MSEIIKRLSVSTGLDYGTVHKIVQTAPERYKTYYIAKRTGGRRKISQPAREVKALQRALIEILLSKLPIHPSAMAYREGISIRDNAAAHARSGPIIKMDFKNFFPSIKKSDWVKYCDKSKCLSDPADIDLTAQLLFQKQKEFATLRLAIGAPSSPMLSNILMYDFDCKIAERLMGTKIIYTRYADDMTFSAPRTGYLHDVRSIVSRSLRSIDFPRLKINDDKTTYVTTKYNRTVTGLVISNDARITIGWRRKKQIRAAVHNASIGKLDKVQLQSLAGMLAFVRSAEPEFLVSLDKKYGSRVIEFIKSSSSLDKETASD